MKWLEVAVRLLSRQWKNTGGYRRPVLEWKCGCRAGRGWIEPCMEHEYSLLKALDEEGLI